MPVPEPFVGIQAEPPLLQLQTIPSGPVTHNQREEIGSCPSSSPLEGARRSAAQTEEL